MLADFAAIMLIGFDFLRSQLEEHVVEDVELGVGHDTVFRNKDGEFPVIDHGRVRQDAAIADNDLPHNAVSRHSRCCRNSVLPGSCQQRAEKIVAAR